MRFSLGDLCNVSRLNLRHYSSPLHIRAAFPKSRAELMRNFLSACDKFVYNSIYNFLLILNLNNSYANTESSSISWHNCRAHNSIELSLWGFCWHHRLHLIAHVIYLALFSESIVVSSSSDNLSINSFRRHIKGKETFWSERMATEIRRSDFFRVLIISHFNSQFFFFLRYNFVHLRGALGGAF